MRSAASETSAELPSLSASQAWLRLAQMFNYNETGKPFRQHSVDLVESAMDAWVEKAVAVGNSMGEAFSSSSQWRILSEGRA